MNDFDANWHKWSVGQVDETINFGGRGQVKAQSHRRLELDLEGGLMDASLSTPVELSRLSTSFIQYIYKMCHLALCTAVYVSFYWSGTQRVAAVYQTSEMRK